MKNKKLFETDWFFIDSVEYTDRPYYRLNCNDSVGVIATTSDNQLILIKQFRPPINTITLEFPTGYVDKNEKPLQAAKRELLEETGYDCDKLIFLGKARVYPSRINSVFHVFAAKNAQKADFPIKNKDNFELVFMTIDEYRKQLLDDNYVDVSSISMFFLAEEKGIFNFGGKL